MTILGLSIAIYVLYRLAPTSIEVVARNASNPVIASFQVTLKPAAEALMASCNALSTHKARVTTLLAASAVESASLFRLTSGWLGPVSRDLPGFDGRGFGANSQVDEDVLSDARRLVDVVQKQGESLPYAQALLAGMTERIDAASAAHNAAQEARLDHQRQQAENRKLAIALHRELVALRRALRAQLGSSNLDYQRLRTRVRQADDTVIDEAAVQVEASASTQQDATAPTNGHVVTR